MGVLGIGGILTNLWEKIRTEQEFKDLEDWLRLGLSWLFTIVIGFCGTAGPALAALTGVPRAIGVGLTTVALGTLVLYIRSPLTKSLTAVVPQSVIQEMQEHPDQTVISGKDAATK
jgi:hypothetical protein